MRYGLLQFAVCNHELDYLICLDEFGRWSGDVTLYRRQLELVVGPDLHFPLVFEQINNWLIK